MTGEGLIHTTGGRLVLLGIWLFLCLLTALAFTVLTLVRKSPPLTTQTDATTGVKEHGIGRWVVLWLCVWCFGPVLTALAWVLSILAGVAVEFWWVGLLIVAAGAIGFAAWKLWRVEREVPEPVVMLPVPEPELPMWSMPEGVGQWDQT